MNKSTKQQIQQKELIIEQLKKTPIVQIVCEKTGLSRATFYRWKKDDLEFRNKIDEVILNGKLLVNDMAESQLISAIKDKNLTAIIFWLKHHHKDYRNQLDISGEITTKGEITPEQEEVIMKALTMAFMPNFINPITQNDNDKQSS